MPKTGFSLLLFICGILLMVNTAYSSTVEVRDTNEKMEAVIISTHIIDTCIFYQVEVRKNDVVLAEGTISNCGKKFSQNIMPRNINSEEIIEIRTVKKVEHTNTIKPIPLKKMEVATAEEQYQMYLRHKNLSEKVNLSVSPNPANETLKINVSNGEIQKVEIHGINGFQSSFTDNFEQLNISSLRPGSYVLKAFLVDGRVESEVFVK